ncbi:hypothetical protein WJX82_011661 [Trebouxia sp. C0006]
MISARSLTARLLAEDVSEAMSNVNARGASMQAIQSSMRMLSSQAVPHFSHCKNILQEPMHASPVLPMLDDIAARPDLLGSSVSSHLGPRVGFLYETGAIDATNTIMMPGLSSYLNKSKAVFSKRFNAPPAFPNKVFDSAFLDHWRQRWEYLRQHMNLSVETIAA